MAMVHQIRRQVRTEDEPRYEWIRAMSCHSSGVATS